MDRWHGEGTSNTVPRFTWANNNDNYRVSDLYIKNGSYMRLKNIQLGYNLPQSLTRKIKMERLRFYLSAQNALTIKSKSFTGVDPENANYGYPIPMNLTFGINVGF
jgi:hypothetical protein